MIEKIDAWILAKHQYVANWVYTRDETKSNYWLASQSYLFALAAFLIMVVVSGMEVGLSYLLLAPFILMGFLVIFIHFAGAKVNHDIWLVGGPLILKAKSTAFTRGLDIAFLAFAATGLWFSFKPAIALHFSLWVAMVIGGYFNGCEAPTRIERKEEQLDDSLVPELG